MAFALVSFLGRSWRRTGALPSRSLWSDVVVLKLQGVSGTSAWPWARPRVSDSGGLRWSSLRICIWAEFRHHTLRSTDLMESMRAVQESGCLHSQAFSSQSFLTLRLASELPSSLQISRRGFPTRGRAPPRLALDLFSESPFLTLHIITRPFST